MIESARDSLAGPTDRFPDLLAADGQLAPQGEVGIETGDHRLQGVLRVRKALIWPVATQKNIWLGGLFLLGTPQKRCSFGFPWFPSNHTQKGTINNKHTRLGKGKWRLVFVEMRVPFVWLAQKQTRKYRRFWPTVFRPRSNGALWNLDSWHPHTPSLRGVKGVLYYSATSQRSVLGASLGPCFPPKK